MSTEHTLTTEELAAIAKVKVATIRNHFYRDGSYFGLTPVKLPNGRCLWPADSRERLLATARQRGTHRCAEAQAA